MAVDTAAHIGTLDATLPLGSEAASELDNNFRHIKGVLKTDFPNITGAVTATHTELNYVDGVTSAIQTQIDLKAIDCIAHVHGRACGANGCGCNVQHPSRINGIRANGHRCCQCRIWRGDVCHRCDDRIFCRVGPGHDFNQRRGGDRDLSGEPDRGRDQRRDFRQRFGDQHD